MVDVRSAGLFLSVREWVTLPASPPRKRRGQRPYHLGWWPSGTKQQTIWKPDFNWPSFGVHAPMRPVWRDGELKILVWEYTTPAYRTYVTFESYMRIVRAIMQRLVAGEDVIDLLYYIPRYEGDEHDVMNMIKAFQSAPSSPWKTRCILLCLVIDAITDNVNDGFIEKLLVKLLNRNSGAMDRIIEFCITYYLTHER